VKKVVVQKVAEGVKVVITFDTTKAPVEFVLRHEQIGLLVTLLQQAARSDSFRFEYQP
jgi:hypothetical protein